MVKFSKAEVKQLLIMLLVGENRKIFRHIISTRVDILIQIQY